MIGLVALGLAAWNLIKGGTAAIWNIFSTVIRWIFDLISLTFQALPVSLKFIYGVGLMFLIGNVFVSLTFGLTNYCCPVNADFCEPNHVYKTNVVAGAIFKVTSMVNTIIPKQDKSILTADELDDVSPSNKAHEIAGVKIGALWPVELKMDYITLQKDVDLSKLFMLSYQASMTQDYGYDSINTSCNIYTTPDIDQRLIDNTKVNCYQEMSICAVGWPEDDPAYEQENGKCYVVALRVPDPATGGQYIDDYDGFCRTTYDYAEKGGDTHRDWFERGWSWILQTDVNLHYPWEYFTYSKYRDKRLLRGWYGITPTDPPIFQLYSLDDPKDVKEDLATYCTVEGEPGTDGYWFQFDDQNVFLWGSEVITMEDLADSTQNDNAGTMFYVPPEEDRFVSTTDIFKSMTDNYVLAQEAKLYKDKPVQLLEGDDIGIFTLSCKSGELDVGLFGLEGFFSIKTFLVMAMLFVFMSLYGWVHK